MKHLTQGQMRALKTAGEYWLLQWPNEASNFQLRVALEKLDEGLRGRRVQQITRNKRRRAPVDRQAALRDDNG